MKINFGSAHDIINGWINVDALDWNGNTNIIHDMNDIPYPFESEGIDEIRCVECLEHLSFRKTEIVLKEFYRIMKKGASLHIQVPDAGKAMEYYVNGEVCDCIKHKPLNKKDVTANSNCSFCKGKGKINPKRWLFTFTGAGKHEFDFHLAIFTKEILEKRLREAGFNNICIKNDEYGWKLKANVVK